MEIITNRCTKHGHPEFVLHADEAHVPDSYLTDLAANIETMVAGGSKFTTGQTFQVGWMVTLVKQGSEPNLLTLVEPDMKTMPIRWVAGITHTLRQMMLQLFMLDSVGLRHHLSMPSARHSLIACTHYTDADFHMERCDALNAADTGWFVGCTRRDHDHNQPTNLRRLSLYEAYLGQRGIQGFVTFPVGAHVISTRRGGLEIWLSGKRLDIVPGSFLDAWFKKNGRGLPPEAH